MKKTFNAPKLKIHGDLGAVTKASGASSGQDFIFSGTKSFPGSALGLSGSQDADLFPRAR
jgi:hypothetical protein